MHNPKSVQVGDKVLVLHPAYVAGKVGVIFCREILSGDQPSGRWLVQVDAEIVVSLTRREFQTLS
ncbi:hypothetical protein BZZ01_21470 [Nostocales cyanobacterium HT-58-2]|nr:hypothetical protein BZZ01_21470 [Nostocales cyanobacterium HT-58-2]